MKQKVKIIVTPRDAMQGIKHFIDTEKKIDYIQSLLDVGFDTIDFGSFVSPKAIPQLRDTAEVVEKLDLSQTNTKLLAIVGNIRGANRAADFEQIKYLGYPFSVSETFMRKNINTSLEDARKTIENLQNICTKTNKELVLYISMAFGNPYGDPWSLEIVRNWTEIFHKMGIRIISISDTLGDSTKEAIYNVFSELIPAFPDIEFGLHLHTTKDGWYDKIDASFRAGCMRYDTDMQGMGGCPMSGHEMIGNLKTNKLLRYMTDNDMECTINVDKYKETKEKAVSVFSKIKLTPFKK